MEFELSFAWDEMIEIIRTTIAKKLDLIKIEDHKAELNRLMLYRVSESQPTLTFQTLGTVVSPIITSPNLSGVWMSNGIGSTSFPQNIAINDSTSTSI